jgi:hypothetical protein
MQGSYFWLRMTRLYTRCANEKVEYHISSKFDEPFGVQFHFLKIFEEPTSVDVIIVLLVEDNLTLYTMVIIVPTKR